MSMIESRVAKLEQMKRGETIATRPPGIPEGTMHTIRTTAAVCATAQELDDYLKTLGDSATDGVVSLDDRRRSDAARSAFARAVFEDVH